MHPLNITPCFEGGHISRLVRRDVAAPMAEGMLRLRRLAADRLLISRSVLSRPLRLLVAAAAALAPRLLVLLFRSAQLPLSCRFLERQSSDSVTDPVTGVRATSCVQQAPDVCD